MISYILRPIPMGLSWYTRRLALSCSFSEWNVGPISNLAASNMLNQRSGMNFMSLGKSPDREEYLGGSYW